MRQKRDAKNSISYSRCLSWIIYMKTISVGAFWFRLSLLSLVSHPLCFGFSLNNAIDMRNRNGSWSGRFVIRFKIPIFYFCRSTEDREIECIFFFHQIDDRHNEVGVFGFAFFRIILWNCATNCWIFGFSIKFCEKRKWKLIYSRTLGKFANRLQMQ